MGQLVTPPRYSLGVSATRDHTNRSGPNSLGLTDNTQSFGDRTRYPALPRRTLSPSWIYSNNSPRASIAASTTRATTEISPQTHHKVSVTGGLVRVVPAPRLNAVAAEQLARHLPCPGVSTVYAEGCRELAGGALCWLSPAEEIAGHAAEQPARPDR